MLVSAVGNANDLLGEGVFEDEGRVRASVDQESI